jgi:hypothetical protein
MPAVAQEAPAEEGITDQVPFHLPRTRWSEDWLILKDPSRNYDSFWRPIKFIRVNTTGSSFLSIGGEAPSTYELYQPAERGLTDIGTEDVGLLRVAIHTKPCQVSQPHNTNCANPSTSQRNRAGPGRAEGISDGPITDPYATRPGHAVCHQSMRAVTKSCLTHCGARLV